MPPRTETLKSQIAAARTVALERHRAGESARRVVEGLSDSMDGILRALFLEELNADVSQVALLAVGGYGRRELCPHSDIDLMFLRAPGKGGKEIERIVRTIWDAGVQLGHSVRTPEECLKYMAEDDITAAALCESRYLAGGEEQMRRFGETLNRYRKRHGEEFAEKKMAQLRASVEGPDRTIFVTEPHLKEGMCCLRDLQQIGWIERMRRGVKQLDDLAGRGCFTHDEVRQLIAAYEFYLRVRCELHFQNRVRQDVLSQDLLPEVAKGLGYAGASIGGSPAGEGEDPIPEEVHRAMERLMSDYYRHAGAVLGFARHYLETGSRGQPLLARLRSRIFSSRVNSFLSLHDGRLFLLEEPGGPPEALPGQVMDAFALAHERDAELSESLAGWIRRRTAEAPVDFAHSPEVDRAFLRILSGGRCTGRILTSMHQSGVLARILPEFRGLTCLVNFDGHHQFTVDEHTLRTLRELDRIERDPAYPELEFARVLAGIRDRLPLRLALLLHDIGKAIGGKHDARGTEAAVVIGERLGLEDAAIETVEFLIYHHLMMFRYSERTDFTDERVLDSFARLVESPERLDMLYLLTYIDIRCVGQGTWTAWKGAQLSDLYARARDLLVTGSLPRSGKLEETLEQAGIEGEKARRILEHCELIENPAYARETIPERMAYHLELAERFRATGQPQVGLDEQVGYSEITFCASDRPHLFADFAGVLLSEGLNILGARIFSRRDGLAVDLFQVEIADRLHLAMPQRVESLRHKIDMIERKKARVADLISERARRYRLPPPRPSLRPPRVHFDNELSETCTLIEVDAPDRTGLLYDLATALSDLGLDLRAAKVSTMIDRAHDVFYVAEPGRGKIEGGERQRRIAETLIRCAVRPPEGADRKELSVS